MAEPKPFASLSSGLLARKGAAKPAMRPQGFGQMNMSPGIEDLGWNDMGHSHQGPGVMPEPLPEHVPSSIAALTPAPRHGYHEPQQEPQQESLPASEPEQDLAAEFAPPPVVEQQRAIEARFAEPQQPVEAFEAPPVETAPAFVPAPVASAPAAVATASIVALPPRDRRATGSKGKAAFTLRLDAERHLKLRLACAVTHRSAQQLVTEALDQFLASLPHVDAASSAVAAGKRI